MQRRRERIAAEATYSAVWRHEIEDRLRLDEMPNADLLAKMCQVRAAAHTHVLTCVDELAGRAILKRPGPPSQPPARFENSHFETTRRQRLGRCQTSQPTADDQ